MVEKFSGPSYQSLLLRLFWLTDDGEHKELFTGTGFIVRGDPGSKTPLYLITNRHILSGRTAEGGYVHKHSMIPTHISIAHNKGSGLARTGDLVEISQDLYDASGLPLWLEHPKGFVVDVVALPIIEFEAGHNQEATFYPYELARVGVPKPELSPSDTVQIVGFPFGQTSYRSLAIWTTGSIASEPTVGYGGYPRFLVDARTREGQSGSPVIVHTTASTPPMRFTDGSMRSHPGKSYLLGVYSGRIFKAAGGRTDVSDIGIVWKAGVIWEIIKRQLRRPLPSSSEYEEAKPALVGDL
ncbi:S1 family peptidase [Arthrobacter pigmenti]